MVGLLRRALVGGVVVLVLLSLAATSALAAPPGTESFSFSRQGFTAEAGEGDCTTSGDLVTCTGSNIFVFAGKTREHGSGAIRGTEVCVNFYTDTFNQATGQSVSFTSEFGCTTDVGAGLVIESDLSSATIAPTTVTLESETCVAVGDDFECTPGDETRDVVVEGTFTATSPATPLSYRSFSDDGVCTFRDSFRGTSRSSMFVGTLDGQAVEFSNDENGYSQIGNGTSSFSQRCAIEG